MTASTSSAASPDNSILKAGAKGSIIDAAGNVWTITGGVVDENGKAAGYTANVTEIALEKGVIWQENASSLWWSWTGGTWVGGNGIVTSPVPSGFTPSPNNAVLLAGATGALIDGTGNSWTISAGAVFENGKAAGYSANVAELAYVNGTIWQQNNAGLWWNWNGTGWAGGNGTSTSPLAGAPTPTPAGAIGSGSDTIVLTMAEDADGPAGAVGRDAEFTLNVDGQQIGGLQTVTASHAAGSSQTFTFQGNFAPGAHIITVTFANNSMTAGDKAAFNDGGDRNVYVNSVSYDGSPISSSVTGIYVSGDLADAQAAYHVNDTTAIPANAPSTPTTTPPAVSVGTGPNTLSLVMCEDPFAGNAQFSVAIDGTPVGGILTTSAIEWEGQTQAFNLHGTWGNGPHTVSVTYLNDAIGTADARGTYDSVDRNLMINSVSYDGTLVTNGASGLWNDGSESFSVPVTGAPAQSTIAPQVVDSITVTAAGVTRSAPTNGSAIAGDSFLLTQSATIQATLGATATTVAFVGASEVDLTGGSASSTITATAGQNVFTVGNGAMTVTGGVGADAYTIHAGSGSLTIQDFSASKGDVLTIDSSLQASMQEGSDGHGGLKISFTGASTVIDLHNWSTAPVIHWA